MKPAMTNLLVMVMASAALVGVTGSSPADEVSPFVPDESTIARLENAGAGLREAQTAAIRKLIADFRSRIAEAERQAMRTPEQKATRNQALRDAVAQGKKGAEVRANIAAARSATAEQRDAEVRIGVLYDEFHQAVLARLTDAQKARLATPDDRTRTPVYTGFIVVRLAVELPKELEDANDLAEVARRLGLTRLRETIDAFKLTGAERLIRTIPPLRAPDPNKQREVDRLVRQLRTYWRIDARSRNASPETILRRLQRADGIDLAYRELRLSEPSVMPDDDAYSSRQGYLDPAPYGIDARFAWTKPYGDGDGVGLVDVERRWNSYHEDLVGQSPTLIFGDQIFEDHGTGVLGEVVARDNTVGIVGIAPNPGYVLLSSIYEHGDSATHVLEAILWSSCVMDAGDVLLLEVQREGADDPIELDDPQYLAIRIATLLGAVVIEVTGNGYVDLDGATNAAGHHVLDRGSSEFRDSGAIFVGASDPRDQHNRTWFSCYGSRVDCFAWGRYVMTCGCGSDCLDDGGGNPNRKYRHKFNGTSSAGPIIAGAAMIVQARFKARTGRPATSEEIRAILANPQTGTPQGPSVLGHIGVMPDLRAIIESEDAQHHGQAAP